MRRWATSPQIFELTMGFKLPLTWPRSSRALSALSASSSYQFVESSLNYLATVPVLEHRCLRAVGTDSDDSCVGPYLALLVMAFPIHLWVPEAPGYFHRREGMNAKNDACFAFLYFRLSGIGDTGHDEAGRLTHPGAVRRRFAGQTASWSPRAVFSSEVGLPRLPLAGEFARVRRQSLLAAPDAARYKNEQSTFALPPQLFFYPL